MRGTSCQINPLRLIDVKWKTGRVEKILNTKINKKRVEITICLSLHNILSKKRYHGKTIGWKNFKGPLKTKKGLAAGVTKG